MRFPTKKDARIGMRIKLFMMGSKGTNIAKATENFEGRNVTYLFM